MSIGITAIHLPRSKQPCSPEKTTASVTRLVRRKIYDGNSISCDAKTISPINSHYRDTNISIQHSASDNGIVSTKHHIFTSSLYLTLTWKNMLSSTFPRLFGIAPFSQLRLFSRSDLLHFSILTELINDLIRSEGSSRPSISSTT